MSNQYRIRRVSILTGCAVMALTLAACASGGGGGGSGDIGSGMTTPTPPPAVTPPLTSPPVAAPKLPSQTSQEYTRNWGVADTRAYAAWEAGATGKGVTVAVVDTGIDLSHPDLSANISSSSVDIVAGRDNIGGGTAHGTRVASIIAAPFNSTGSVGIAYNASIMSIRADVDDCTDTDSGVCFKSSDLARSLDYAVANGARIINLSLGGSGQLGQAFEQALQRAVNAGAILAVSAGNSSEANPGWPGRYATDPRFAGSIIVVGAHDNNGNMANFSNKAGVAQNAYLSAPGSGVVVDCKNDSCWGVGGTSFAAPAVAAAMALMQEAFPNLSGPEIVDILLRSAAEAGDKGTDTTWGRGKLDIERAFQPIGITSTPSADGAAPISLAASEIFIGGPFGDAMVRTNALATIAYDEYDRLFSVDVGNAYRAAPRRSYQVSTPKPMNHSTVTAFGPAGTRLTLAASLPVPEPEAIVSRNDLYNAPWMGGEERREALFDIEMDNLSFSAWQGVGGASSPFRTNAGDAFAALAQSDHAIRGAMRLNGGDLGHFIISADTGTGDRRAPLQQVERNASTYARMGIDWRMRQGGLALSFGALDEKMGPLGSYMPARSDLALPSTTRFTALGGDIALNKHLTLIGEAGVGRTEIDGRFMKLSQAAISSSWRVGLQASCPAWAMGCRSLTWEFSQPLRIESGQFEAYLADAPDEYFDPVTFSRRSFSASPSGRQIDMSVRSLHALPGGSSVQLEATAIRDEQHRRNAKPGYAFMAVWRAGF